MRRKCEICGQWFEVDEEWYDEGCSAWYICPECMIDEQPDFYDDEW